LFSLAKACIQAASGQSSNGSTTQAGLPMKGAAAKASMVHWRMVTPALKLSSIAANRYARATFETDGEITVS
jgi:hypothetical protein